MGSESTAVPFRVFRCSTCQEFINTTMSVCRFCGSPVDAVSAKAAIAVQTELNTVCSGATSTIILAGLFGGLIVFGFIGACIGMPKPFILRGVAGASLGVLILPLLIIGLLRRIKRINRPGEPGIQQAKRCLQWALAMWLGTVALTIITVTRMIFG